MASNFHELFDYIGYIDRQKQDVAQVYLFNNLLSSKRAFTNACRVATDKANHLCNNMDVKLGECIKIEELSSDWIQNSDVGYSKCSTEF